MQSQCQSLAYDLISLFVILSLLSPLFVVTTHSIRHKASAGKGDFAQYQGPCRGTNLNSRKPKPENAAVAVNRLSKMLEELLALTHSVLFKEPTAGAIAVLEVDNGIELVIISPGMSHTNQRRPRMQGSTQ